MKRSGEPRQSLQNLWPALLLVGAVLTVAWAGAGGRFGPQWLRWLFRHRPAGIIVHHTASDGWRNGKLLDAAMVDADHANKGWGVTYKGKTYHIAYHYLILADGTVQPGRPEGARGAHTRGHGDYLGICLVGDFSGRDNPDGRMKPDRPTPAQMEALTGLVRELMHRYDLTTEAIYGHGDFTQTDCPGDRFPFEQFKRNVREPEPDVDSGKPVTYNGPVAGAPRP